MRSNQAGFTLVELMIVVLIIGILAAIALPSYDRYVIRTNRTDAQAGMMAIAQQLQKYRIANFTFTPNGTPITLATINTPTVFPTTGNALYNLQLSNVAAGTWTLTATPIASARQKGDGHIVLNHRGWRCWTEGTDNNGTACVPSATTSWDGR